MIFIFKKVEDFENIQINSELFQFNNLVKLLNANKNYNLNFSADHLVKLDSKFLDAEITFIDKENNTYYLNKDQRVIKHLTGDNIKVISTKNALVYFYKKIPNYSEEGTIIFNREQKRKNMKFTVENKKNKNINITLARDFGFKGYYPLISQKNWDRILLKKNNITTVYIENYYDKSDYDLYEKEGEDYIIYIFDSLDINNFPTFNSENFKIDNIEYFDNLLTPGNKYNFELIKANFTGSIILNLNNIDNIKYQFVMCKSENITFKIENSNGYFKNISNYPYEQIIKKDNVTIFGLNNNEILSHSFESDDDFLFIYNTERQIRNLQKNYYTIHEIKEIETNILLIKYEKDYASFNRFYIIVAKKDEINNRLSFSDICYVAKLLSQNITKNLVIKTVYEENKNEMLIATMNISKLNAKEKEELVITLIGDNLFSNSFMQLVISPIEFKLERKNAILIKPEETIKFHSKYNTSFKFNYNQDDNNEHLLIISSEFLKRCFIFLYSLDSEKQSRINVDGIDEYIFYLTKSGTYYIEFFSFTSLNSDEIFTMYITGNIFDTIDFTKRLYYKSNKIELSIKPEPNIYKVNNLKKDILVFFHYKVIDSYNYDKFSNPFEICNENNNECSKDFIFYKFLKKYNYTIYIHYVINENEYSFNRRFYFASHFFFPIFEDTIENKEEGYYTFSVPKIYIFNLENIDNSLYGYAINNKEILTAETTEEVILDNSTQLDFDSVKNDLIILSARNYKFSVIILVPFMSENPSKLIISKNLLSYDKPGEYFIPGGKSAIILYDAQEDEDGDTYPNYRNPLDYYNHLSTFNSSIKNMKLLYALEENEFKDFVIQNYFDYPIYINKSEINSTLVIKTYGPRYSFFLSADNNLFNLYWSNLFDAFDLSYLYKLDSLTTLRFVINSEINTFYEFFNFYFYGIKGNNIFYIKQYYGNTELYEYNPNLIQNNDFSILTKPRDINIKNKKSILNKLVKIKNNKLIFGYLGQDSFLDIYFEINNKSRDIIITQMMDKLFRNTLSI